MPGAVEVEVQAGDVLVHDDMIIHGSPPAAANELRRTVYLEFRPYRSIVEDGPWTPEWAQTRARLVPLALAAHAELMPAREQFEWRASEDLRPPSSGDPVAELRVVHEAHTPGVWCSPGPT